MNDGINNGIFKFIYIIGDNRSDEMQMNSEFGIYISNHKPLLRFIAL